MLYAATGKGLLRTTSGGTCWEKVADAFFDIAASPFDPNTLYAVAGSPATLPNGVGPSRVFKTTNAWDPTPTFQALTLPESVSAAAAQKYTRAVVAVAAVPNTVYAAFANKTVTALEVDDDESGNCAVTATVANSGDAAAGAATLSVEGMAGTDRTKTEVPIAPLAVGENRQEVAMLSSLPCSPLNVLAEIDSRGEVAEAVEGNNRLRQIF
jgi:hypothetical protein